VELGALEITVRHLTRQQIGSSRRCPAPHGGRLSENLIQPFTSFGWLDFSPYSSDRKSLMCEGQMPFCKMMLVFIRGLIVSRAKLSLDLRHQLVIFATDFDPPRDSKLRQVVLDCCLANLEGLPGIGRGSLSLAVKTTSGESVHERTQGIVNWRRLCSRHGCAKDCMAIDYSSRYFPSRLELSMVYRGDIQEINND
jgi:hypothetical protein